MKNIEALNGKIRGQEIVSGNVIKDVENKWHVVTHVYDNQVYVSGSQLSIHISKILAVKGN